MAKLKNRIRQMSSKTKVAAVLSILVLAILKLVYYYVLMDAGSKTAIATPITLLIFLLIFTTFKRKWIFSIIYLLTSFLMLVDVNYFRFFNRNLSVATLGATDLLGGVTESIKELFMPSSLLLMVDAVIIMVICIILWPKKRTSTDMEGTEPHDLTKAAEITHEDKSTETAEAEKSAQTVKSAQPAQTVESDETGRTEMSGTARLLNGIRICFSAKNLCLMYEEARSLKYRLLSLVLVFFVLSSAILMTPNEDSGLNSILSQEFWAYHLRDAAGAETVSDSADAKEIVAIEGNYDKEKKGDDFGCAKGMNLVVIQIEAMQNFVINETYRGQEITPFINRLLKEDTFYFNSYYQQTGSGNTSDAEFATNNSMYGSMSAYTYSLFQDNYWSGLPVLLKNIGYSTAAFHAYEGDYWNRENAYPGQGFDKFYSQDSYQLTEMLGMGLSDSEFFSQSMEVIANNSQPFYNFMVTLSSHYPFDIEGRLTLDEKDRDTIFGDYLESMSYVDSCLEEFFDLLKEKGLYDNTVVAFYGDHLAMNPKTEDYYKRMTDYLGYSYDFETALNIPLVIHVPGSGEGRTIETVGGQTDFLPTIAYLLGLDSLDTIYFGHNLCTIEDNFVPMRTYVQEGSFVAGDIMFKMARSGIFADGEAVNIRTHEDVPIDGLREQYIRSLQQMRISDYYMENDILRKVLQEGNSLKSLLEETSESGYVSPIATQHVITDAACVEGENQGLYCLENFNRLYESGVRAFAVNLIWAAEGRTLVMNSVDELEYYFTRSQRVKSYETFERAQKWNARDGITAMTGADLINWANEHPDVLLYISVSEDEVLGELPEGQELKTVYFATTIRDSHNELLNRTIFVANDSETVRILNRSQLYNVIFHAGDEYSAEDIIDLASQYRIYGAAVDMSRAEELVNRWTFDDYVIYAYSDAPNAVEEADYLGLDGVVITCEK